MVRIKICSVTTSEQLNIAVKHGADAVGFVVESPGTPRNLSLQQAAQLRKLVPPFVHAVLVSSGQDFQSLINAIEHIQPDFAQIHGILDHEVVKKIEDTTGVSAIMPVSISTNAQDSTQRAKILVKFFRAILLEASTTNIGGLGQKGDWSMARQVRDALHPFPVILSGGLTPDNVAEAIDTVRPYAVDVSSGVESSKGIKDLRKITQFLENARGAQL